MNYTPFGHSDWATIVGDVVALGEDGKQVGVISTINGDANIGFYKELAAAGISADDIPVVAFFGLGRTKHCCEGFTAFI